MRSDGKMVYLTIAEVQSICSCLDGEARCLDILAKTRRLISATTKQEYTLQAKRLRQLSNRIARSGKHTRTVNSLLT